MSNIPSQAHEIAKAVRNGTLKAADVFSSFAAEIEKRNPGLGAFTDLTLGRAEAAAACIDEKCARGEDPGPLAGVPYAVKNLFDVEGVVTRAGSKILRDNSPALRDAALIERLDNAGAILMGALNMGEFAYDFTGENSHDGNCHNPRNPDHMSGGSSSGSGSAVAAGLVPIALGSDTNGSIRVPSALCGTFGLKPTYGRLPRTRTYPFCDSLDHLGPLALSPLDLALSFDAMQGKDPEDPVCADKPVSNALDGVEEGANGLRVALAGGYFAQGGQPEAHEAAETVARVLNASSTVELPEAHIARSAAYIITNAESSAFHMDHLRDRAPDFDADTRYRFLSGALLPASWYVKAQAFRRWYHDRVLELFQDVDVIIAPATPCAAPKIGQKMMTLGDGSEVLVRPNLGIFTQPISFIGLPVVVAPLQRDGELPLGVQIIAAPWREDIALRVARELERAGVATASVAR